jgi:uncharacterized membrane protein
MTRRSMLARLDTRQVEEAIARAERAAAVELRVSVAGPFWGSPQRLAERAFQRLGMTGTRRRNGVLILLAPWRRRVVLVADDGITGKVPASLWTGTVAALTAAFAEARFTEGLTAAIEALAQGLAPHFPPGEARPNELPDRIDRG